MEENTAEATSSPNRRWFNRRKIFGYGFILAIAVSIGCLHYKYVAQLFENNRNFSYLSELEREMSLQTEMGFYYSYYKTVVDARPYLAGIQRLMCDRYVEYPKEVNALNRFNIGPEVIIGSVYRYLEPWLNTTYFRECHLIDRAEGPSPIESCIGIGEPIFFYLEAIWWLAGVTVAAIFIHATSLSGSVWGGLLAALQYFANHPECTRVQWAPNERENFAAPLLLLQSWLLTLQLRSGNMQLQLQIPILALNIVCLLFWQFTQFIFLTQIAIVFVMEQLKIIHVKSLALCLHSHFFSLHTALLLLHGNVMLKSSLYMSYFLTVSIYCMFFSFLRTKVLNRVDFFVESVTVLLRISVSITGAFHFKEGLVESFGVQEDSHVWDMLYSKFTNYKTFHTLIYTCMEVFDFLPLSSIKNLSKTLLIPFVLIGSVNVVTFWIKDSICRYKKEMANIAKESKREKNSEDVDSGIGNTETAKKKSDENAKSLDLIQSEVNSKETNEKVDSGIENTETAKKKSDENAKNLDLIQREVNSKETNENIDSSIENTETVKKKSDNDTKDLDLILRKVNSKETNENIDSSIENTETVKKKSDNDTKDLDLILREVNPKETNENVDSGIESTETVKEKSDKDTKDLDLILREVNSKETKDNVDSGIENTETVKEKSDEDTKDLDLILREVNPIETNENVDSGIENTETVKEKSDEDTKDLDLILREVNPKETKNNVDPFIVYVRSVRIEPEIFFNLSQMVVFGVMAALVMRLKLLFSTQMCIVSSLIVKKSYIFPEWVSKYWKYIWMVVLLPVFAELIATVRQEMSHFGEYSDYPQEQLMQWISKETVGGVFAGSMPVLATVLLTTRRPVVAHPHYEHAEARQRAYAVYKVYGRFSPEHYYQELTRLRATHLIVETKYCYGKSSQGCTFEYIWDIEAPSLKSNPKLCHTLLTEPVEHFMRVFHNEHYSVFLLYDFSVQFNPLQDMICASLVQYMPRSFDT